MTAELVSNAKSMRLVTINCITLEFVNEISNLFNEIIKNGSIVIQTHSHNDIIPFSVPTWVIRFCQAFNQKVEFV